MNYNLGNYSVGKKANKVALQKELGLPIDADIPLIAFIGRLDFQKGADIVMQASPWILQQGVQLVCLGTGDPGLEVRPPMILHPINCMTAHTRVWRIYHCDGLVCGMFLYSSKG